MWSDYISLKNLGVVQVLASGLTPIIADRLGRKIILMFSALGMAIALVTEIDFI